MRIALASFVQESHSFSPVHGSWMHFGPRELLRGAEIVAELAGTRTEVSAVLDTARARGVDVLPLLAARASASAGPQLRTVFESIRDELLALLRAAGPVDGILLVLHGAMVAEGYDDATGEVLRAFRQVAGPQVPIVGTLDLHANVTRGMVEQASALVGYHTAPHVDLYETGQRGIELLLAMMEGKARPVTALRRLPMILPGETGRTTEGPYAEVMDQAIALAACPGFLDVSVFSVQPWLDVPDVGCSVLVTTDGDRHLAEREAERLASEFWRRRQRFDVTLTPLAEALAAALHSDRRPYVLADSADAPSSGAPGDSTAILAALLREPPERDCLLNIVDPAAVETLVRTGVGQVVTLKLGAAYSRQFYQPVEVSGRVRLIADGDFVHKGPGLRGFVARRGRTVVLAIGHIQLVVMERPVLQWDPELYRSVGLEPADAQVVVVKSPAAFRAAYEPFAAEVLIVDAPGVCSPNLRSFPFSRVRRPLYPLDEGED